MASTNTRARNDKDARQRARDDYDPKVLDCYSSDKVRETAIEATRRFQRMLPGLRSFARIMTRDPKVHVVLRHGTPCTDGRTIYMRPPIELGEKPRHGRDCGERDDRSILVCPACRTTENIEATLYHEVAHIAFGTFAALDDRDRLDVLTRALAERGIGNDDESRASRLRRRIEDANPYTYIAAARLVSPFLPAIVNALEDARVNTEMYRSRPGTYKMLYAQGQEAFACGVRQDDGTIARWDKAPLNAQAIVGLFAKAAGFDYATWFNPRVVEALDSAEITRVTESVRTARSVRTIYKLSLTALEALRPHGFCVSRNDPEEPPAGNADAEETATDEDDVPVDEHAGIDADSADDGAGRESDGEDASPPAGTVDAETADVDVAEDGAPETSHQPSSADDEELDAEDPETQIEPVTATSHDDEGDLDGQGEDPDDDLDDEADLDLDCGDEQDDDYDEDEADENEGTDWLDLGDADEAEEALRIFGHHSGDGDVAPPSDSSFDDFDRDALERAVDRAIVQAEHFDTPSRHIWGINEHRWGQEVYTGGGYALTSSRVWPDDVSDRDRDGWGFDIGLDTSVLAQALARARIVFADNRKARHARNLRGGRINNRVLARRVPVDDPRIFAKKTEPGAKDYFVVVGLDISGSTALGVVAPIKAAGLHMAELLHRLGVRFAVYAHTGTPTDLAARDGGSDGTWSLDIVVIKDPAERWTAETRERLVRVCPMMCNLDGHTLEYYRKVCERQQATDKLVMYFTDGAMPAENYTEELDILQREIRDAPRCNIKIVGVGVGTDSPRAHGLDTIRLDHLGDVPHLVRELERRITG